MHRAILGGLVLLLVIAADAPRANSQTQPRNGAALSNVFYPVTRNSYMDCLNSTSLNDIKNQCDFNNDIILLRTEDYISRTDKIQTNIIGSAVVAATVNVITILLMAIGVWFWRRSPDSLLRKRDGDDLRKRLEAIEDLLRKRDGDDLKKQFQAIEDLLRKLEQAPGLPVSEDATNAKPASAPPTAMDAPPPPETRHVEDPDDTNDPVIDFIDTYNKLLTSDDSISDFLEKYGMRQINIEIKARYYSLPSMIRELLFYGYDIGKDTIAVVPEIVIFDDLYISMIGSLPKSNEPDEHLNKYFEIRWMAESRLSAPLILGPSNEIIHRGVIQLRGK